MDTQLHVLDAKREYMTRLSADVAPFIEHTLQRFYNEAVAEKKSKALLLFQRRLREIPSWNEQEIQTMTTTIQNHLAIKRNAKNQYLSSLIAMAFVSYLKIMSSCRLNQQKTPPQMRLKLPSNAKFIHRCFIEAARMYYENPYIVRQPQEKQLAVISKAVETAVRELIPLEDILDVYLQDCVDDSKTVPPILSPVQSDDEEDGEEANDDAFSMAFRPEEIQDEEESDPNDDTFNVQLPTPQQSNPPMTHQSVQGVAQPHQQLSPQPVQAPQPSMQQPPPPPPSPQQEQPQEQPQHLMDIPTAHQFRQEVAPPPSQVPQPMVTTQQQAQNQLYNDASDDDDFH